MQHTPHALRRGAVLRSGDRLYMVADAEPFRPACMPIVDQNLPRDRWDFLLDNGDAPGIKGQRLMVRMFRKARRPIDAAGAVIVTHLTDAALVQLARQYRRSLESEAIEARYRAIADDL